LQCPTLTQARKTAFEMSAIKSISTLNTAQIQYFSTYGRREVGEREGRALAGGMA